MSLPLHIVLKLLSAATPSLLPLIRFRSRSLRFSLSVSLLSFTGLLLHYHFSQPQPGESWERSCALGSWRLCVWVCVRRDVLGGMDDRWGGWGLSFYAVQSFSFNTPEFTIVFLFLKHGWCDCEATRAMPRCSRQHYTGWDRYISKVRI